MDSASAAVLAPLPRPLALRDRIHERLRGAILRGELAPGTPVIEAELATQLGASRTPIREALRRLESEGLLVPRGARGTVVRSVDPEEANCVFEIRDALESLASRRAAAAIDADGLTRLERRLAEMRDALDDPHALERADTAFHDEVVQIAGGQRLTRMLTEIREETIAYRFLSLRDPERRRETVAEHAAILAALRERDAERAGAATSAHLANARRAIR